jgi:SAM-dependent methyltransferase
VNVRKGLRRVTSVDPADFYTGIVAELYGPLKSFSQDPEPYAAFIQQAGMPALELGCGDGDPLLELRRRDLDVDGVDSSADMLERLRRRADEQDIPATVFHQRMESLNLPRRYRAIFLAGPTFTLLPDDATALAALLARPDGIAFAGARGAGCRGGRGILGTGRGERSQTVSEQLVRWFGVGSAAVSATGEKWTVGGG